MIDDPDFDFNAFMLSCEMLLLLISITVGLFYESYLLMVIVFVGSTVFGFFLLYLLVATGVWYMCC